MICMHSEFMIKVDIHLNEFLLFYFHNLVSAYHSNTEFGYIKFK